MQICVARMLRESGIFFAVRSFSSYLSLLANHDVKLLALLGTGFTQGLFALDAADGRRDQSDQVVKSLIEALLAYVDISMLIPRSYSHLGQRTEL